MIPLHLPDALHGGWIGPQAAIAADEHVRMMQLLIEAGLYSPDCREVAEAMLAALAPARRH